MLAAVSPVLRLARKGFKRPVKLLVVNSKLHGSFLAMSMKFHGLFDSITLLKWAARVVLEARRVSHEIQRARNRGRRKCERTSRCGVVASRTDYSQRRVSRDRKIGRAHV